ncbi:unnamed protein product, partial [marine sediment metagenome]
TWVGEAVPGNDDHAVILDGHTVKLKAKEGTSIKDFTIDAGGVLNADNKKMNISGTFIVNGTYTAKFDEKKADLTFTGNSLGGTGYINVEKGKFTIGQDVVIIPTTDLLVFIKGTIEIDAGVTVTNKGTFAVSGRVKD